MILGDYDHRNPGNDADVLAGTRTMHREVRQESDPSSCAPDCPGDELQSNVFDAFPVVNVWDDHDYCCDDSDGTFDGNSPNDKPESFQAHGEYWPGYTLANPNDEGLWHKFSYGSEVEIYVLDLRYQRAPKTDNDTCLGGNPSKSMLADFAVSGTNQKAWLKAQLAASTATWKFLISSVTWNRTTVKGDAWLGYLCEQNELLNYIDDNDISGVVLVSGDIHTGGAVDGGSNARCPEVSVPRTNVPGPATCFFGCGDWTCDSGASCITESGTGYALVQVNPSTQTATLTTKSWVGLTLTSFSESVAASNVCTSPP